MVYPDLYKRITRTEASYDAKAFFFSLLIGAFCIALKLLSITILGFDLLTGSLSNFTATTAIVTCLVYPILFETHFRLWLKPSARRLSFSLAGIGVYYICFYSLDEIGAYGAFIALPTFFGLLVITGIALDESRMKAFYEKNGTLLMFLSLIISSAFFLEPFLKYGVGLCLYFFVIQLGINGAIIFVRLRYGFFLGLIVHIVVASLGLMSFS